MKCASSARSWGFRMNSSGGTRFRGRDWGVRILCALPAPQTPSPRTGEGDTGGEGEVGDIAIHSKFASVVLPIKSVGVQGDGRTYRHAVSLFGSLDEIEREGIWRAATEIPIVIPRSTACSFASAIRSRSNSKSRHLLSRARARSPFVRPTRLFTTRWSSAGGTRRSGNSRLFSFRWVSDQENPPPLQLRWAGSPSCSDPSIPRKR